MSAAETLAPAAQDTLNITALIATRDRPEDLERLLASLTQTVAPPALRYSAVVVDNSANRSAEQTVLRARTPFPIRYQHEARPGLSRARNAGLRLVSGGYIATLDDDIIVPADYLVQLERVIRANPDAGVIGGRVELHNADDYPISIRLGDVPERYDGSAEIFGFIPGCNQIIRRDVIDAAGTYDVRLGAGTPAGAAEDDDMVYRIWKKGYAAAYAPELVIFHNHGRKAADADRLQRNYIKGNGAFVTKHLLRFDANAAAMFRKLVPWCFKAAFSRGERGAYARRYLKYYWIGAAHFLLSLPRR